jgi:TolB-like protein
VCAADERAGVRRFLAVVLAASLALPLLAATPSAFTIKPIVVVYPFTATGSSIDREASSRLATILATQMANTGQVTVIPPPPGTERKDYLSVARSHNADYYISGYMSPLGNGVSLVEQVVSTTTGIVVYSQSAQINTYDEAAGQGDDLATFIARHANRGLAAIPTAPPQSTSPTPAPSGGPEANLGKLFGRRKKNAATPKPAPTPKPAATEPAKLLVNVTPTPTPRPATVAVAPPPTPAPATGRASEGIAVVAVEGGADATLREYATQRLLARTNGERAANRAAACAARPVRAVLAGTLGVRSDPQFGGGSATFELTATDCAGKVLWQQTHSNDAGGAQGQQLATERAVDAAIGAYLNPPKRRRR